MSDFRSLLSTFESATGSNSSSNKKKETTTPAKEDKDKSLKELTSSLWRWSQIRSSTKSIREAQAKFESKKAENKAFHIAVCICIVDRLPHENVWKEWVEATKSDEISAQVYIHAKNPEDVRGWAKSKLISITHRPNWNDVRVVKAMLSLMTEALKDSRTTHVLFATEGCIPICHLTNVVPLISHDKSVVSYYGKDQATRFDERDVWDVLGQFLPLECIHKALPGWCTLCRRHAQDILDLPSKHLQGLELWTAFKDCWAPEEAFFPTALALLGLLRETEQRSLTHAEWPERTKIPQDKAHPKVWDDELDAELVSELRSKYECAVLRKVKQTIPLERWKEMVGSTPNRKREAETDLNRDDVSKAQKTNDETAEPS